MRQKVTFSNEQEAVAYLEKVISEWSEWAEHHRLVVEAVKVLINKRKEKEDD